MTTNSAIPLTALDPGQDVAVTIDHVTLPEVLGALETASQFFALAGNQITADAYQEVHDRIDAANAAAYERRRAGEVDPHVRIFPPDPAAGDLGPMYVLDVFGINVLIRQRDDGIYVHIDRDGDTPCPAEAADQPLLVEVNNTGESAYG